jgi:hypothetical protein
VEIVCDSGVLVAAGIKCRIRELKLLGVCRRLCAKVVSRVALARYGSCCRKCSIRDLTPVVERIGREDPHYHRRHLVAVLAVYGLGDGSRVIASTRQRFRQCY